MKEVVLEIVTLLEDIPLDIQTGKDNKAVTTIQRFSYVTDKLFRLVRLLTLQDDTLHKQIVDMLPLDDFIDEYKKTLKELVEAYEVQDAILVGDLSEYELAPRLLKLYTALTEGRI